MTQTDTDLSAVQTAAENIYRQSGPASDQIGEVITALELPTPDVVTALAQAKGSVTNVSYLAFQAATLKSSAAALAVDLAPAVTPPVVGTLDFGEFHGNDQTPAVAPARMLDYCDGSLANSYSFSTARTAYMKGRKAVVKCGPMTNAQAIAFAKVLIAAGFPDADVPHMWEGNQDNKSWAANWNETKYTTALSYITQMLGQIAAMDSVPGAKFNHWWCPNLGQAGAQAPGRNELDTWPGIGPNKNIGIAPDGYFAATDGSDILGQLPLYENLAKSAGAVFGGLCETGPNNGQNDSTDLDIPLAWTNLIAHAKANDWRFIIYFGTKVSSGGSFNSDNGPNAITAIQKAFAS